MHSGLCLVKRKKPTDPDVNQQAAFAVEIMVFLAKGFIVNDNAQEYQSMIPITVYTDCH